MQILIAIIILIISTPLLILVMTPAFFFISMMITAIVGSIGGPYIDFFITFVILMGVYIAVLFVRSLLEILRWDDT